MQNKNQKLIWIYLSFFLLCFLGLILLYTQYHTKRFDSKESKADEQNVLLDFNADGLIDVKDLNLNIKALKVCEKPNDEFSQSSAECLEFKNHTPTYDINNDSKINILDTNLMIKTYKVCNDTEVDDAQNTPECTKYKDSAICIDKCGDGICQEVVCLGSNCPCAESNTSCPRDCKPKDKPTATPSEENPTQVPQPTTSDPPAQNDPPPGSGHCPPHAKPRPDGSCEYGCWDESGGRLDPVPGCGEIQQETPECDACQKSGMPSKTAPCFYTHNDVCIYGNYNDCRNCNYACCEGK